MTAGYYHNLGFYELLYMLFLCAVLFGLTRWRRRPVGLLAPVIGALYAPVRFFLDFLRVDAHHDPRFAGLTFAQWVSLILAVAAVALVIRVLRHDTPAAEMAALMKAGEPIPDRVATATAAKSAKGGGSKSRTRRNRN
jgi:prolipoprotein diacylglyceryltransferase